MPACGSRTQRITPSTRRPERNSTLSAWPGTSASRVSMRMPVLEMSRTLHICATPPLTTLASTSTET